MKTELGEVIREVAECKGIHHSSARTYYGLVGTHVCFMKVSNLFPYKRLVQGSRSRSTVMSCQFLGICHVFTVFD